MKILIAGASGAIGQPLVSFLVSEKHDVYGITQSKERAQIIESKGAKSLILDVLDREFVFSAIGNIRPDVVIDMLTRLPKEYTPESMRKSAKTQTKI
jgi:nucleoside-diphosphate-sugar epimerase